MANVLLRILRPCTGRRGAKLKPGDIYSLHRLAAEAYIRYGKAMRYRPPEPEPAAQEGGDAPRPPSSSEMSPSGNAKKAASLPRKKKRKVVKCRKCGRTYKTKAGLERHMERKH